MWQRFTERARRVIILGQQEALKLRSGQVGTEHLLLGLLLESQSTGAALLGELGVDANRVRAQVLARMEPPDPSASVVEPKLTPLAKRSLELAADEARRLGHEHIGSEHILLALLRSKGDLASAILGEFGVELEAMRRTVKEHAGPGDQPGAAGPKLGPGATEVLSLAAEESKAAGQQGVETEHILLALLRLENGRAAAVLRELGVSLEEVRRRLGKDLGEKDSQYSL